MIERHPKPGGQGSLYELTAAGRELWPVIIALGTWGEKWVELTHEHADPTLVLWSWTTGYLEHDRLPRDRVVIRFDCPHSGSGGSKPATIPTTLPAQPQHPAGGRRPGPAGHAQMTTTPRHGGDPA